MKLTLGLSLLLAGCAVDATTEPPAPPPEAPVDPGPTTSGPGAAEPLLRQWSGCMSLANFRAANMAPAWSALVEAGACTACHGNDEWPTNDEVFFRAISQHSEHLLTYFRLDQQAAKVITNDTGLAHVAAADAPYVVHPRFDASAGLSALQTFYSLTAARLAAGQCDPPRLID